MTFMERLSSVFGKQYLFKHTKDTYYNRYIDTYQTKEEAQDWLVHKFYEGEYKCEVCEEG